MFKRIISRDNGTPWPSPGMTTAKWLTLPVREFLISELIATQPGILLHALAEDHVHLYGDPHPHVVEWENEYYLEDGHHRVFKALLRGEKTIRARHMGL